jgi:hypothetical protein
VTRFVPVVIVALAALGLLIGGESPAWWSTGLAAVVLFFAIWLGMSAPPRERPFDLASYLPAAVLGAVAFGLLLADVSPAWWVTGVAAVGLALLYFVSPGVRA